MKIQPPKHPQNNKWWETEKTPLIPEREGNIFLKTQRKKTEEKKNSVNCLAPSIERGITWLLYLSYGVFVLITLSIGWTKIKEKEKAKAKLRSTFQA